MDFKDKLIECAKVLEDRKALDTVILELKGLSSISDYFMISSGTNSRHAASLADYAEDFFAEQGIHAHHKEGLQGSDWIVLDYMDFMIHVFNEEKREYYNLDKVWQAARKIYG